MTSFTDLPAAFVGNIPSPIKCKTRRQTGFDRLPFVAGRSTQADPYFWAIPASGGYMGGSETGKAMALAYLKFLREEEGSQHHCLSNIVESFMIRFEQEGGKAMSKRAPGRKGRETFDALKGQYCGFFNMLSLWLAEAAKQLGPNLDMLEEQDLVSRANEGLGFDEAAFMSSMWSKS